MFEFKFYKRTSKMELDFYKRRFVGVKILDFTTLNKQLQIAIKGKSSSDFEDVARLLTLILFLKFLVPTSGHTLAWNFLGYVEDLSTMKRYN